MHAVYILSLALISTSSLCDGACDQGFYESGVSESEKNYIVDEHNKLRLLIAQGVLPGQPRGINLKRMYWDNDIAQAAQNIADTCVFGHVAVSDPRWSVGQNLAATWSTEYGEGANWTSPIYMWWDEYKKYTFGDGFSMETGHYTQMAWDDTMYVGCGYTYFETTGEFKYEKLYVCNYGPAGNYPRAPYQTGTSGCENLC